MPRITEPLTINRLTLKNRLVMPPMGTYKAADGGTVTPELIAHYAERAEGGHIGLIIIEHCCVAVQGRVNRAQVSLADDGKVEGLSRLTAAVHACGSPVMAQINHAGSSTSSEITGCELVSAADVVYPKGNEKPRPLTLAELRTLTAQFAAAARRAKEAGFDGVEIHSAHGYLLNQFYSPLTNTRADEYGGSLENRLRLHLAVIAAVRGAVGADYPLALRLGGCDYMNGGSTIDDAVAACVAFEKAGVDLLDITGGLCRFTRADNIAPGYFSDMSSAVKRAVSVPVILTGGVSQLSDAERLLREDAADLIGVGRALLHDADWARKAFAELKE